MADSSVITIEEREAAEAAAYAAAIPGAGLSYTAVLDGMAGLGIGVQGKPSGQVRGSVQRGMYQGHVFATYIMIQVAECSLMVYTCMLRYAHNQTCSVNAAYIVLICAGCCSSF